MAAAFIVCQWIPASWPSQDQRVLIVKAPTASVIDETAEEQKYSPARILIMSDNPGTGAAVTFLQQHGITAKQLPDSACGARPSEDCLSSFLSKDAETRDANSRWFLLAEGANARAALELAALSKSRQSLAGLFVMRGELSGIEAQSPVVPVWLFTAALDERERTIAARRLAAEINRLGGSAQFIAIPGTTPQNAMRFHRRHLGAAIVLDKLAVKPLAKHDKDLLFLRSKWQRPPFNSEGFWRYRNQVKRFPVEEHFRNEFTWFYRNQRYRLNAWPLKHYYAIDLFDYLRTRGIENDRYLTWHNIRGEALFLDLDKIRPHSPVIVIGVDDETNLFRLVHFYKTRQQYSWFPQGRKPQFMAQTLGAFLHFRSVGDETAAIPFKFRSSLLPEGIKVSRTDPLVAMVSLPSLVRRVLTTENHCAHCHHFRGVGGRAHHIHALNGAPTGGYALPLSGYSREIMQEFLIDQVNVAHTIGVSPNHVRSDAHELLLQAIGWSR